MRKLIFSNDQYYHVFNRGVDKRKIFLRRGHYIRFIKTIYLLLNTGSATEKLLQNQSLALKTKLSFICYCLMPNHYHMLLKQTANNGITEFMHNLNTSYTKFFNLNSKRKGRLFEYTFEAVSIENDSQLIHLSRYIHLNPLIGGITNDLLRYQWSSYLDYIGKRNGKLCEKQEILKLFSDNENVAKEKYQQFVLDQINYAKELHQIKKAGLD